MYQSRFTREEMEEFINSNTVSVGEEIHVHHCKQGRNNDRLYISHPDRGTYLAYCHHCGKSGYYDNTRERLRAIIQGNREAIRKAKPGSLTLPEDCIASMDLWPIQAKRWIMQYGITQDEVRATGITYSPYYGRVILPHYNEKGELLMWSGRYIKGMTEMSKSVRDKEEKTGEKVVPTKYETRVAKGVRKPDLFKYIYRYQGDTDRVVLVEDMLSAIKCSRICDALPLNGASAKIKDLTHLSKYDIIYIFLDNDNYQVKKSQNRLKAGLELLGPDVRVIHADRDAKEHNMKQLKDLLL